MPLTLPPLSRRRFLQTSLAAGAGMLLGPAGVIADENPAPLDRVALLADTHIHADPAHVARDINMADHLRAAVARIVAQDPRPSDLFISGDLALNTGEPGDYRTLLDLLAPVRKAGVAVHMAMGNHDDRTHFRAALSQDDPARQELADRHVLLVEKPCADWLVLDSLDKPRSVPGVLGDVQLDWLKTTLDRRSASKPVIVMVHHHPRLTPEDPNKKFGGLLDSQALLEILLPRRQVKTLLFGHTHVWSRAQIEGLHLVNLPALAYVFDKAQPSAHIDARIAPSGALFMLRTIDPASPRANEEVRLDWRSAESD